MRVGLSFADVTCARGGRVLFSGVSFALGAGDVLTVGGPNGVGKSSLLRVAAGLLRAEAGVVTRDGDVALADEAPALDPALPLSRALQFWADIDGGSVKDALASVDMAHLAQVPVRMLSTGQRRRATLARTLASGATIWLLDEPANGLDAAGVTILEGLIATHRLRGGIAVVATHQALALPDAQSLVLG
ncbi:heme ABC exporter ATP-binding protein CcmA [Sphingomonas sp. SUN039]|uniref:heme ABC exporter ATP-binding protein CcmA n=1 Tax=Sphingomonas sp. SUN039 TaxID=2937787 RepID=UPI00216487D6|nr:heme ABC exporter ATP-binding protein CcmA [Sphingomonas sp. SUN039]UVO54912.1 heme ABC exporter ATP-binding protein CcmA [Sphingomonas sp. SUN039]